MNNNVGMPAGSADATIDAINKRRFEKEWENRDMYLTEAPAQEVKTKSIETDKKSSLMQKAIIATASVAAGSFIAVMGVDFIMHPENYLTTLNDFEGTASFGEIFERTPENFSAMYEVVKEFIGGKVK